MLAATACGGSEPPEEPDATTEETEQALFQESTTCQLASLSGACQGPWSYRSYAMPCYNLQRGAACGTEQYQEPKYCLVAQSGLQFASGVQVDCVACSISKLDEKCQQETAFQLSLVAGNKSIVTTSFTVTDAHRDGPKWVGDCTSYLHDAGIAQNLACGTTTSTRYSECRHSSFGNAPMGQCGNQTNDSASALGLTESALLAASPYLNPNLPRDCSTLENAAVTGSRLSSTLARTSPAHTVWANLPASEPTEQAARDTLARNAKLMYELGIAPASNAELEGIRALYTAQPERMLSCGVTDRPQVSQSCKTIGLANGLEGALEVCTRMLSSHVVQSVFLAELDRCLDVLAKPELRDGACGLEYRNIVETVAEKLMDKAIVDIHADPSSNILGLNAALQRIDRWYHSAAIAMATDTPALNDATGRVLAAFWKRVYEVGAVLPISFPAGEAGSEGAKGLLSTLFGKRIDADRQVLAAAFADPAPLDEAPLLLITADALTSLQERLRTAAPTYDYACRIKGCTAGSANEATLLLRLIGAIGTSDNLQSALTAADPGVRASWRAVFTALQARRSALELAYQRAAGDPTATLEDLYFPNVVPVAAALEELVMSSWNMWLSYQSHGVLLPRDGSKLRAALHQTARTDTEALLVQANNQLNAATSDYQRTRGDFANSVLTRINQQQHQARLASELVLLQAEFDDLAADLDGLMNAQDQAEQTLGSFMQSYKARASEPGWLPDYPIVETLHQITLHPSQARGNGGPMDPSQLTTWAVRDPAQPANPLQINVAKGDMLNFNVTGLWAPSCALRAQSMVSPTGHSTSFRDPVNAMTGSEGYSMSWSNSGIHAFEHSSTDFSTRTTEKTVCGSAKLNLLQGNVQGFEIFNANASASYCKSWQTGHTDADKKSDTSQLTGTAQFAGGLRIAGTPFLKQPGGAVLAIEVNTVNGVDQIVNIHVVRPNGSILFGKAGKVYLLINDKGNCSEYNSGSLNITYGLARPSAVAAQALADAMADALIYLAAQAQNYIAQGSVTAGELNLLQSAAYDRLRTACNGCDLSTYPEQIRGMFDVWVNEQTAAIERQTRIVSAMRALDKLVLRTTSLRQDIEGAADSSRLMMLMTSWQLGHLAYHELNQKAARTLEVATDYVIPMLRIRFPQALTGLRGETLLINNLLQASWELPFDERAYLLRQLMDATISHLDGASVVGGNHSVPVMVAFPKPNAPADPTKLIPTASIASADRLTAVWEPCAPPTTGYCLRSHPVFTITPQDVYGQVSQGLGCTEAAPIVRSAAFFAANTGFTGNDAWNATPRRFDNFRSDSIFFPTEEGILIHRVGTELRPLINGRMRSIAGTAANAWPTFASNALASRDFEGSTPFGTFELDLGTQVTSTTAPFATAHTVAVIFEVETRGATGPLSGVTACTGAN